MNTDKKLIILIGVFSIGSLVVSITAFWGANYYAALNNNWFYFISDLFLGLLGGGVLAIFASLISVRIKFKKSMNKMLYIARNVKRYYDRVFYFQDNEDQHKFVAIAQKIIECFDEFYQNYHEIEYMLFNRKDKVDKLFVSFGSFVSPFVSVVRMSGIPDKYDIEFYCAEAKTVTKPKFFEFLYCLADVHELWNQEMFENFKDVDDWDKEIDGKAHLTVSEIMQKRYWYKKRVLV